jgi:hypothetical protein
MTEPDARSGISLAGSRVFFAPLGTPLPTSADLDLTDQSPWIDMGHMLIDGLVTKTNTDPGPPPTSASRRVLTSLPTTASFTITFLDIGRAGWRVFAGPRPPYGFGWRRRQLTRRQVLHRMHTEYGRRRR